MWCILGFGRAILETLEATLWPRGLPRANKSSRKHRIAEIHDLILASDCFWSMGLLCGGSSEVIFGSRTACLAAILGVWEAVLGGYVVHFGPRRCHFAYLGSHLVAKRAAESQHEQPEPERCRSLVDVAQQSSNKFCRDGGKWWQVVADEIRRRNAPGLPLLRRMQKFSEFVKVISSRPAPLRGRRIPSRFAIIPPQGTLYRQRRYYRSTPR